LETPTKNFILFKILNHTFSQSDHNISLLNKLTFLIFIK